MSGRGDDRIETFAGERLDGRPTPITKLEYSADLSDRVHEGVRLALAQDELVTATSAMTMEIKALHDGLFEVIAELTLEVKALREALAPAPIKAKRVSAPKKENEELFQAVVGTWNAVAAGKGLPQVADITDRRQGLITARGYDLVNIFDFPGPLCGFTSLLEKVASSPFLRGENKIGFKADFDWVLNKSNFTKIMEGKYDPEKPRAFR